MTDAEGRYALRTIKPAPCPLAFLEGAPDESAGYRTRHIHFRVSKRGHAEFTTQMYFAGEQLNEVDVLLARVPVYQFDMVVAKA